MKCNFLKKLGIVVLSLNIICGTTAINSVCVYAEEIQGTNEGADGNSNEESSGSEHDNTEFGAVNGVVASSGDKVTVQSVERTDILNSEEHNGEVNVVQADAGSEVIVNGDVNVTMQGTVGTQITYIVDAGNSNVSVKGSVNAEDTMSYTKANEEGHENSCTIVGINSQGSKIDVGGDVTVYSMKGRVTGIMSYDSATNIHGSIITSSENKQNDVSGAYVIPIQNQNPTLIVDGDINVKGGYMGMGVWLFGDAKTYVKGNMSIESREQAYGFNIHDDSIAVVDGVLSVKVTESESSIRLAKPYDTYEAGNSARCYVYQYVDKTDYSDKPEVDLADSNSNFSHLKYIIRTDEGLTTNANTFSDTDLGITGFYYSGEGESITVSSNGRTIYGIKNADSSIDIKVRDNGNGTWTIVVPRGGGVHLQAILERVEEFIYNTSGASSETEKPAESVIVSNINQALKVVPSVTTETVVMTQAQLAENVVGSKEYISKQAEIEAAMTQAMSYIDIMTTEQLESVKASGLSIDAGGCAVADAKVSQLIVKSLNRGIPMNVTFRINGNLVKLVIPAGFDVSLYINADGTIDFLKLFAAMMQSKM